MSKSSLSREVVAEEVNTKVREVSSAPKKVVSDITIAGSRIAKKYRWKVRTSELKSVKTANNEPMIMTGIANERLLVGKSDIYVTPDIDDMILGVDWLRKARSHDMGFSEPSCSFWRRRVD